MGLRTKRGFTLPQGSVANIVAELGNHGMMLVLFETPSGFAILSIDGVHLCLPDAMENIWATFADYHIAEYVVWLKEFKTFKDKSSAIRLDTGVNRKLSEIIMKWRCAGQVLVVGKPEYKTIIETSMGIPCLCDDIVMEVMWGLKNIMPSLVPEEKSELTRDDRLPMSQGLKRFLNRYGFDVNACALLDCELIVKKCLAALKEAGEHIKDVSGINTKSWTLLKLARALMIIFYPEENIVAGNPNQMFTDAERLKLQEDVQDYNDKMSKRACLRIYKEIVCTHAARPANFASLTSLVKEAKAAYEAEGSSQEANRQTSWN